MQTKSVLETSTEKPNEASAEGPCLFTSRVPWLQFAGPDLACRSQVLVTGSTGFEISGWKPRRVTFLWSVVEGTRGSSNEVCVVRVWCEALMNTPSSSSWSGGHSQRGELECERGAVARRHDTLNSRGRIWWSSMAMEFSEAMDFAGFKKDEG